MQAAEGDVCVASRSIMGFHFFQLDIYMPQGNIPRSSNDYDNIRYRSGERSLSSEVLWHHKGVTIDCVSHVALPYRPYRLRDRRGKLSWITRDRPRLVSTRILKQYAMNTTLNQIGRSCLFNCSSVPVDLEAGQNYTGKVRR